MDRGLGAEQGQLGVALGDRDQQRAQAAHDQEPAGRGDPGRGRAAQRAQHEARRDERELDHRDVLEHERVHEGERHVHADQHGQRGLADPQAHGLGREHAEDGQGHRVRPGEPARRHRPGPLDRVQPVPVRVHHVVDEVHGRRGHGEHDGGHQRVPQAVVPAQRRRRQRRREDQQVLGPLPGARGLHDGRQPAHREGDRASTAEPPGGRSAARARVVTARTQP